MTTIFSKSKLFYFCFVLFCFCCFVLFLNLFSILAIQDDHHLYVACGCLMLGSNNEHSTNCPIGHNTLISNILKH